jgi:hypothetical protein
VRRARVIRRSRPSEASVSDVRPFRIDVPEDRLAEMRRRIEATPWPVECALISPPGRRAAVGGEDVALGRKPTLSD